MKVMIQWLRKEAPYDGEMLCVNGEELSAQMAAKISDNGVKTHPSPKEFVGFGQGGCTAVDVISTLKKMREPLENLKVECDFELTKDTPSVFSKCGLTYYVDGSGLNHEKVARAVSLSLQKYCGVSAMLEKSGCFVNPALFVNGKQVSIWDPENVFSNNVKLWWNKESSNAEKGVAIVIGASRGIGRSLCHKLSELGYGVISAARGPIEGERASLEMPIMYLDVTNEHSRNAFVEVIKNSGVVPTAVFFNSGFLDKQKNTAMNLRFSEVQNVFNTNVFSIIELNQMLLPLLGEKSSLYFIASYMGLPTCNDFDTASYRLSKGALILYARELGKELLAQKKQVAVAALHPGSVKTAMNPVGKITPAESAERIVKLCTNEKHKEILERNGEFWMVSNHENKITPWQI